MTPASGQEPDETPAGAGALVAARDIVSSTFIRREAGLAASDEKHSAVIRQRFGTLRTRVLREMRSRGWRSLAIVPLRPGAGGTFVAVNLSLALARQQHTRVALVDLNLADPGVARELGVSGCGPLGDLLREGKGIATRPFRVAEAPNLSVLAPENSEPEAAELLQDNALAEALKDLQRADPDEIVIYDVAPLLSEDAALAALPLADALLLVADGQNGTAADMAEAERLLVGMPPVLGVILNKSED